MGRLEQAFLFAPSRPLVQVVPSSGAWRALQLRDFTDALVINSVTEKLSPPPMMTVSVLEWGVILCCESLKAGCCESFTLLSLTLTCFFNSFSLPGTMPLVLRHNFVRVSTSPLRLRVYAVLLVQAAVLASTLLKPAFNSLFLTPNLVLAVNVTVPWLTSLSAMYRFTFDARLHEAPMLLPSTSITPQGSRLDCMPDAPRPQSVVRFLRKLSSIFTLSFSTHKVFHTV
jgi:hypothetical protein